MVLLSCLQGVLDEEKDEGSPGKAWRGYLSQDIPYPRNSEGAVLKLIDNHSLTGVWDEYADHAIVKAIKRFFSFYLFFNLYLLLLKFIIMTLFLFFF